MRCLVDTNVLVLYTRHSHPKNPAVVACIEQYAVTHQIIVAPQVLFEFGAVCSRPKEANGLGLEWDEIERFITYFNTKLTVLPDSEEFISTWLNLCSDHHVRGKQAHDARLAAYMACHGIETIITLNVADFKRYAVEVVEP